MYLLPCYTLFQPHVMDVDMLQVLASPLKHQLVTRALPEANSLLCLFTSVKLPVFLGKLPA